MFEALAEFLPILKAAVEWREPAIGGQGVRVPFSAYSFVARQKSKAASGAQPRDLLAC